jgi:hypothetical protein
LKKIKLALALIVWTFLGVTAMDFIAGILLHRSDFVTSGYVFGILAVSILLKVRIAGLKLRELFEAFY